MTQLRVKRLSEGAKLPVRATAGAACFDLHADGTNWNINCQAYGVDVVSARPQRFATGLAFEVPEGHVMLIFGRSGHGFNNDTRLANCVGVVDQDYRGEVMVKLTADELGHLKVRDGDRIAQAMILKLPDVELVEVTSDLSETARGTGGFGSTGA